MAELKNKVAAKALEPITATDESTVPDETKTPEGTSTAPELLEVLEPIYKLKQKEGTLHIGGGIFFYPGEEYSLEEFKGYEHYFEEIVEVNQGTEGEE